MFQIQKLILNWSRPFCEELLSFRAKQLQLLQRINEILVLILSLHTADILTEFLRGIQYFQEDSALKQATTTYYHIPSTFSWKISFHHSTLCN
jgi:hypothetical protein